MVVAHQAFPRRAGKSGNPTGFRKVCCENFALDTRPPITEAMELHLTEIAKIVETNAHALLIVDGAGWHGAKNLKLPDNITLLKLPPYAPELNPMENVWQYLRANKLAITVFDTYEDILDKCSDAWNFFANDPERIISITHRDWIKVK